MIRFDLYEDGRYAGCVHADNMQDAERKAVEKFERFFIDIRQQLEDLGCLNTMFNPDDCAKVDKCRELKHHKKETKIGNCYYRYTCDICKITYTIDSSD